MTATYLKTLEDQLRAERFANSPVEDAEIVEDCGEARSQPNPVTEQDERPSVPSQGRAALGQGGPSQICDCDTPKRTHLRIEHCDKDWLAINTPPGTEYVLVQKSSGTAKVKIFDRPFRQKAPDLSIPLESREDWQRRIQRVDGRTDLERQDFADALWRESEATFWREVDQILAETPDLTAGGRYRVVAGAQDIESSPGDFTDEQEEIRQIMESNCDPGGGSSKAVLSADAGRSTKDSDYSRKLSHQENPLLEAFPLDEDDPDFNRGYRVETVTGTGRPEGRPKAGLLDPKDIRGLVDDVLGEHSWIGQLESDTDKQNVLISYLLDDDAEPRANTDALREIFGIPKSNRTKIYRLKERGEKVRQNQTNREEQVKQEIINEIRRADANAERRHHEQLLAMVGLRNGETPSEAAERILAEISGVHTAEGHGLGKESDIAKNSPSES